MLSLQGMIAKELDAQGALPQKFKDLILGPKYPLIKFVNSKGIVPTDSVLPVDDYRFVYEDGSALDYVNSTWELEFHTYLTAVGGSSFWSHLGFFIDGTRLKYFASSSSSATTIHTFVGFNDYTYNWVPMHIILKMQKSKITSNYVNFYVKAGTTEELARSKEFSSAGGGTASKLDNTDNKRFRVRYCGTSVCKKGDTFMHGDGQVFLEGMRFVYNDRVILGE